MTWCLASIVEGPGDASSLPLLIRLLRPDLTVCRPINAGKGRIMQQAQRDRYLQAARVNVLEGGGEGGVLILIDADDDCAKTIGRQIKRESSGVIPFNLEVAVAVREFEGWLIAGDPDHQYDGDPESPRNPKATLRTWYGRYRETADQPRLTAKLDLDRAQQHSPSLRYLVTCLDRLHPHPTTPTP